MFMAFIVGLSLASFSYTLQFKQAEETVTKMDLDGLVVIGGDDSNTNACLLAENFRYMFPRVTIRKHEYEFSH